jgi:hypothetical protein
MRLLAATLALAGLLVVPTFASATANYSYAGDYFETIRDDALPAGTYTTEMRITGSFERASELGANFVWDTIAGDVLSYSFNDGRVHLTEANSRIIEFIVATDALGNIERWSVYIVQDLDAVVGDQAGSIRILYGPSGSFEAGTLAECLELNARGDACGLAGSDAGEVRIRSGGYWTLTPEPTTASLFGLGLLGMAAVRRRRRRGRA